MSESVYAGLTSQTVDVFLGDSSSTTGAGLTGLVYNSSGLSCYYRKGATGSATSITLATQTVGGAWSSGGFVQIDATNMPGVYRFDVPNAVVDSEGFATVYFSGATNLVPTAIRIDCRPLPSDLKKIQTDAQSVTDLKDFADAGYDPATNKVQGVVLVDTTTTNTDMRGTDSAFLAASAPTNFGDLAITATTGLVSVGTNNDKAGYSISGTKTTLDALNDVSTAQVNAEVDTALADYDAPTNSEMTAAFTEIKGATWSTNDTLEAIRDRGDAAWTTADVSALATSAALATVDANVDSILVDTGTSIPATLTTILADTNELQTNQGNWTTADVSGLATAEALATVDANVDAILVDTGTTIPGTITTIDANLDAVKAITDQINFGVAGQIDANVESINTATVNGTGTSADKWRGS